MNTNKLETKGIALKVWWKSREILNYVAGLLLVVAPLAANSIGTIGLDPRMLMYWTLGIAGINYTAGILLRLTSNTVVASKAVVVENDGVAVPPVPRTEPMENV